MSLNELEDEQSGSAPRQQESQSAESLKNAASDSALTEDLALALLKRPDLPAEACEALTRNANLVKLRKVRRRVVEHPRTPRHVSLAMLRHLYTFDLMQVALTIPQKGHSEIRPSPSYTEDERGAVQSSPPDNLR